MKSVYYAQKKWSQVKRNPSILTFMVMLFILANCSQPQINFDEVLPIHAYQEDLNELASNLIKNHPAPYAFQSKDEFEARLEGLNSQLDNRTSMASFVWMCKKLVASLNCGNTFILPQDPSGIVPSNLLFPMEVGFIDDRLVVLNPMKNEGVVPAGAEIQSINGMDISVLKEKIFSHISADGGNLAYKQALLNKRASEYIAYQLNFPKRYSIESQSEIFQLKAIDVPITYASSLKTCPQSLCLDLSKAQNMAIMTIRSFDYEGRQLKKFTKTLDEAFQSINERQIENLIIDIRENKGGNPYVSAHLLRLIAKDSFKYLVGDGDDKDDLHTAISPSEYAFTGNKWILINGNVVSTSAHFVALAKANGFAQIAGTETGSTYIYNGKDLKFTLPYSGLQGYVARSRFTANVSPLPLNQGIKADIDIPLLKEDLFSKEDLQLEKLIDYITKNRVN